LELKERVSRSNGDLRQRPLTTRDWPASSKRIAKDRQVYEPLISPAEERTTYQNCIRPVRAALPNEAYC
jgi:hypothetical protein